MWPSATPETAVTACSGSKNCLAACTGGHTAHSGCSATPSGLYVQWKCCICLGCGLTLAFCMGGAKSCMRCMGASTFSLSTLSQTAGSPARVTAGPKSPQISLKAAKTCCSSIAACNTCKIWPPKRPKPHVNQALQCVPAPVEASPQACSCIWIHSEGSLTFNRAWPLLHATACIVHQHVHHAVLPEHISGKFGGRLNVRKILQKGVGLIGLLMRLSAELQFCPEFASLIVVPSQGCGHRTSLLAKQREPVVCITYHRVHFDVSSALCLAALCSLQAATVATHCWGCCQLHMQQP